jgi:hypothetical protein
MILLEDETLLKEAITMKSAFYELGDSIEGLERLHDRNNKFTKDRKLKEFTKKFLKLHFDLRKHIDKEYPGWD